MVATKLSKNLCAPTSLLHVANLPDTIKSEDLKTYITDHGFTVTSIDECGKDGSMALVQMASVEEAVMALAAGLGCWSWLLVLAVGPGCWSVIEV